MGCLESPGVALHHIWLDDYESVARRGLLCWFIRAKRWTVERPYKAQRQAGTDLISVWDPWSFRRAHWRGHPLGSENRPWDIFSTDDLSVFSDEEDWKVGASLFDRNEENWVGVTAVQQRHLRQRFDRVRKIMGRVARVEEPAPGLAAVDMHSVVNRIAREILVDDQSLRPQLCLVLSPNITRYEFPGYKTYESFVRGRVQPGDLRGIIVSRDAGRRDWVESIARGSGHQVYYAEELGD